MPWELKRARAARAKAKSMGIGSQVWRNRDRYYWSPVRNEHGVVIRYMKLVVTAMAERKWKWTGDRFVRLPEYEPDESEETAS